MDDATTASGTGRPAGDAPPPRTAHADAAGLLLERDGELSSLERLLREAAGEQGRLVLVEGLAGIGKTRLLTAVCDRAAASGAPAWRILAARGSELERAFPFGVVRQLFEPLLADPERERELLGGAAAVARSVFDTLQTAPDREDPHDASFAALHALYWMTVNATAAGPLLLAIDDLHWCDRASLRFLVYLVRRLEGLPLLLAATVRSSEPGTDPALIGEFAQDPRTAVLRPGPLSAEGAAALTAAALREPADAAFAAACHRVTSGNPLLLRQLLASLAAEGVRPAAAHVDVVTEIGPRAISRTVLLRLARLSADAVEVARAVAVLGDAAELPVVAALARRDERAVAEATGELTRAEILRPRTPLGFVHPLVREAVYQELAPGERDLQHAQAARLLAGAGAPSEQVASHLLLTPRRGDAWVVDVLRRAGRAAFQRGAADSAIAYLQRALEETSAEDPRRTEILHDLGLTEAMMNGTSAIEHLGPALERQADPRKRAQEAYWLARMHLFTGNPLIADEIARRVAAELPAELVDDRDALRAVQAMAVVFGTGDRERLRLGVDEPGGEGPGSKMLLAMAAYNGACTGQLDAPRAVALARRALAGDVLLTVDQGLFGISAVNVLVFADDDGSLAVWDTLLRLANERGSLFATIARSLWRSYDLLMRGELVDACESVAASYDEMLLWNATTRSVWAYPAAIATRAWTERGDLRRARAEAARGGLPERPSEGENMLRHARVELLLAEGRAREALEAAEQYDRFLGPVRNPALAPVDALKATALDALGRREEAAEAARAAIAVAEAWGAPAPLGRAHRVLGTIERERGIERLEHAVAVLERSTARLERARALLALGRALRRARKPGDAREPLRRALELAEVRSAAPLAEEARAELRAAGARPRTTALSGVAALTASELRVATLAARGAANREIAERLFVTPKTVEVHLTSAYRKLGIRSRRELAGALADGEERNLYAPWRSD